MRKYKLLENRNLPANLELLPELYRQFNLLSILYLQKHYPECEWHPPEKEVSYNDQNYICDLKLFAEGAVGTEFIIITIDNKETGIYIVADTIKKALEKINFYLDGFS